MMQVTKVWWDGEKLMAEPIDPTTIYQEPEQPARRTWQGLTEMEKSEITNLKWWDWEDSFDIDGFIRAIEAKLKEKNNAT
jgi:hypothetical protein